MKKIACVLGSPRTNGNSSTIAKSILATAEKLGAQSQIFELNKLNYKGCAACMGCKTGSEECVTKDDMILILEAVRDADALIITSPIYCGYITGQMKCCLDRFFSFLKPDFKTNPQPSRLAPGKKCVLITTQGSPDPSAFDILPQFVAFFGMLGFDVQTIRGIGLAEETDAANNPDLMKQAEDAAKKLVA